MTQVIYNLNDNLLELIDLKDVVLDAFVNAATVAFPVLESFDGTARQR